MSHSDIRMDTVRCIGNVRGSQHSIRRVLSRARRVMKVRSKKLVSVVLCDTKTITNLNRTYRKKNRSTDVLSFLYSKSPFSSDYLLGEIFICTPVARKQAQQYKNTFAEEIQLLTVHGFLHLLGFDHATQRQSQRMRRIENHILKNNLSRSAHI